MILQKRFLLILSCAGMMLACFYAWSSFIFASLSRKPIPALEAGVVLTLAMLTTYLHSQRGWRIITVLVLHLFGYLVGSFRILYHFYEINRPFWRFDWVPELLIMDRVSREWPIMVLILLCVWALWFCGLRLITKPTDKAMISYRFDMGLGFLLFLFLVKLVLATKEVSLPITHSLTKVIVAYISLGLFSMGLVHTQSQSKTQGSSYLKGAGVALTFTAGILMLGGGLFILFLPQLQTVAEAGYGLLGNLKGPLENLVITLARGFLKGVMPSKSGAGVTGNDLPTINRSGEMLSIFDYLFIGIGLMILLSMIGFILYRFLKWIFSKVSWLLSKTAKKKDSKGIWTLVLLFFSVVKILCVRLKRGILGRQDTSCAAENIYLRFLRWGRFSGLRRLPPVTPKEYGGLLGLRFPQIKKEIETIINMHAEVVYGGFFPESHQISSAKSALRRMRHPFLWFARLKSLLF